MLKVEVKKNIDKTLKTKKKTFNKLSSIIAPYICPAAGYRLPFRMTGLLEASFNSKVSGKFQIQFRLLTLKISEPGSNVKSVDHHGFLTVYTL